jgi:hypothetical protein
VNYYIIICSKIYFDFQDSGAISMLLSRLKIRA